jgi:heat shock protein HslJ
MTQIELYLKCFEEVLARWCFAPQQVDGTKVVLKPISSEAAFSQNFTKTLQIKAQSESVTLSLSIHSVYFALNGLLGALFTK